MVDKSKGLAVALERCEISVVILAGGRSRRMGQDKADLVLDVEVDLPRTMLELVLDAASYLSRDIIVVGREPGSVRTAARYIPDAFPGIGPLGGLVAGLRAMDCDRCLLLACDMPFVSVPMAKQMFALSPGTDVTAIVTGSRPEPFHAIYHRRCLTVVELAIASGDRSLAKVLTLLKCQVVEETLVEKFDPERWCLFNVNTPDDVELARQFAVRNRR